MTQLNLAKGDPRAFWSVINKAFLKTASPTCKEILDESTGDLVGGGGEKGAILVNNFFVM